MALQCDLDLGLKALEEKKKALKDKLSNLADVSGLSDIKTAADEQLQALKDALPEIPEIPDFQKDFDDLKNDLLSGFTNPLEQNEKLNNLKKNWGKAVDNIDEILDVLQNPLELLKIDPCAKPDPAKGDIVIPDISKEADGSKKEKPLVAKDLTETAPEMEKKSEPPVKAEESEIIVTPSTPPKKATRIPKPVTRPPAGTDVRYFEVAKAEILDEFDEMIYEIDELSQIRASEIISRIQLKNPYNEALTNSIPREYQERMEQLGKAKENYFLENPDIAVPKPIDDWYVSTTRIRGLDLLVKNIQTVVSFITVCNACGNSFNFGDMTKLNSNGILKSQTELDISKQVMFNHIRTELLPITSDAEMVIPPSKLLENVTRLNRPIIDYVDGDFYSAFKYTTYSLTDIIQGNFSNVDDIYSDIYSVVLDYFYVHSDKMIIRQSKFRNIPKSKCQLWAKEDLLPTQLGGNLTNELTQSQMDAQLAMFSQENFEPHYMYNRNVPSGGRVFVETYEDHEIYSKQGYTH
tara:strand:- start:777 stop:2339 length:1563 start_codon:yes stop_codon:yes gene_type:complete